MGLLAVSCRQDPIFFIIASETVPRKPRIEGAPTNMVIFEREYDDPDNPGETIKIPIIYVASGKLHWYVKAMGADEPKWDDMQEYPIPQPTGKIISLAVADDRLYALCLEGHSVKATLQYIKSVRTDDEEWTLIEANDYPEIHSIYADPQTKRLFAGAGRSTYSILYLDNDTDMFKLLKSDTSILSGAHCRQEGGRAVYYLSTRGDGKQDGKGGIFRISEADIARNSITKNTLIQLKDTSNVENKRDNRMFMGMIKLENNDIIAVERNGGALYKVQNSSFSRINYTLDENKNGMTTGKYSTGALVLWENYLNPDEKLLIVGIQGGLYSTTTSSYTNGYVEFVLKTDGSLNTNEVRHDSGSLQSLYGRDKDQYTASLGKHPINHLFQVPKEIDEDMTFFASTQTAGLWSYRERDKKWQWNAED